MTEQAPDVIADDDGDDLETADQDGDFGDDDPVDDNATEQDAQEVQEA